MLERPLGSGIDIVDVFPGLSSEGIIGLDDVTLVDSLTEFSGNGCLEEDDDG